MDQIVKISGVEDMLFDEKAILPREMDGKILLIKSKSIEKKAEAFI